MKDGLDIDGFKKQLSELAKNNNDKISRSIVRKWMIISWVSIVQYFFGQLVKNVGSKKHAKIQSIAIKVTSVINNFLNYRIINDLGLTNDEANTKMDQVLTKHITRIAANFKDELDHVNTLKKSLTVNVKDNAGFLVILPNLEVKSDSKDIVYDMDLKERRFFCVVKREESYIKYEKGLTINEVKDKYPNTQVELHGIANDVPEDDIVVFDGIDDFYRSLPADMSYGLKEMQASGEMTLITVMDQKRLTGTQMSFFEIRDSNLSDFQAAVEQIDGQGVHDILTREIVEGLEKTALSRTMSNSLIVWDGHPATFKLGGESNYQLFNLRHIDFDQTVTKALKDTKWTSKFVNALILITTGDNMFNITGSLDKLRTGLTEDQKDLRESETEYPDIVKKEGRTRSRPVLTDGDVNITTKTEKKMRDDLGKVVINGSHTMNRKVVVTKIVTRSVAFIKQTPEHDQTVSKFHIIKELKIPSIKRSYEEEESTLDHSFYITPAMINQAAKDVLIENIITEGPVNSLSSIITAKDLTSAAFGGVPALTMMNRDESEIKLANESFAPFSINETRYHINAGCVNGEEMDSSTVVKTYGKGALFNKTVDDIFTQTLNDMSLSVHPTDYEFTQEYKPLTYQTLNDSINSTALVFKTSILRSNQYGVILKLSRTELHDLIYSYEEVSLSRVAYNAYESIAQLVIESMTYNPYFYVMLSMKYDIDSRFSNEIVNVWDTYLQALSDYSNIEQLIIHHMILNRCKQNLIDDKAAISNTEDEIGKERKRLIESYKGKQEYYTQALKKIDVAIEAGDIDVNLGFKLGDLATSEADGSTIDSLNKDNQSLKEQVATQTDVIDKANEKFDTLVEESQSQINKLQEELDKKNADKKKSNK